MRFKILYVFGVGARPSAVRTPSVVARTLFKIIYKYYNTRILIITTQTIRRVSWREYVLIKRACAIACLAVFINNTIKNKKKKIPDEERVSDCRHVHTKPHEICLAGPRTRTRNNRLGPSDHDLDSVHVHPAVVSKKKRVSPSESPIDEFFTKPLKLPLLLFIYTF